MYNSRYIASLLVLLLSTSCLFAQNGGIGTVTEIAIQYPHPPPFMKCGEHSSAMGSTHEITFDPNSNHDIWITGQNEGYVVKIPLAGNPVYYPMPDGSGPHGIEFDAAGRVWVTLEFAGKVVRLTPSGQIDLTYDVNLACSTCPAKLSTHPHGMGFGPDGKTIWYTGKSTGTVGRIQGGKVQTFGLPTVGSVPIYIKAGPDGNMWVTELVGNLIARVTPAGKVDEFCIPTPNSRPIAIVPEPGGQAMWFTEEAGNRVARIDMNGKITEFPIPKKQNNMILAGLAFDSQKNLWIQQYVDQNNPLPEGVDYIIKLDKSILQTDPTMMAAVPITFYPVPTPKTVFHRIIQGPDGNMWFTEMKTDKVGKLISGLGKP
jgi:virginiamycin B lyase